MEARPEAAGDDATEAADQGAAPAVRAAQARARWVLPAAWSCLGALVVALVALAVFLLFRMDLFADEPLTDEKIKSLWAFLGVALGAAATVIGALLTDQNSRRSATLAKEAEERAKRALDQQIAQDHETATRLTLDTRARVLELITYEGDYAPKARVAGALATLMELRGGPVACRILDELLRRDKIGTSSAVWIVERVLESPDSTPADKEAAAGILALNATTLFPARDSENQDWNDWPDIVRDRWPTTLPPGARDGLMNMAIKALQGRGPDYWMQVGVVLPVEMLRCVVRDDEDFRAPAAHALTRIYDVPGFLTYANAEEEAYLRAQADERDTAGWFEKLVDQFGDWPPEAHPADRSVGSEPSTTGRWGNDVPVLPSAPSDGGPAVAVPEAQPR